MSLMRMLSPVLGGPSSGKAREPKDIKLRLIVPSHGTIFVDPPANDPLWPRARSQGPRDDILFNGLVEVVIPPGARRRCKSVRVGFRTKASLKMSSDRGWEHDTIFERRVELLSSDNEGMLLDEGVQRFEFTLILPSTLGPHDWHHNAKVNQELYAVIEGMPSTKASGTSGLWAARGRGSKTSLTGYRDGQGRAHSPVQAPQTTRPNGHRDQSPTFGPPVPSLSITRQAESFLSLADLPKYEEEETMSEPPTPTFEKERDDWITGMIESKRNMMVVHLPQLEVSDLDERQNGYAHGIGMWNLRIASDIFSIGGPIHTRITLPDPTPDVTIFYARLLIKQTHTVRSYRDDPNVEPATSSRSFPTIEHGMRPPQGVKYPGKGEPAIWRGTASGGKDTGELKLEGNARMPKDDRGRPTTLPGIVSPVHVTHSFVYEVFFAVWGEDERGNKLAKSGPGGLRVLQIERPVIVPSCILIPSIVDLPEYYHNPCDVPCRICGCQRRDAICSTCPPTIVPHPRHDHPPSLVGNKDGICPVCSDGISVDKDFAHAWDDCACGEDVQAMEERMGKFVEERQAEETLRDMAEREAAGDKARAERGERARYDGEERGRSQRRPECNRSRSTGLYY